mmetsp:Transcript_12005/g.15353  ORF Transcript_12005/g.15353 Transcript_12005/m.15353 type:complete len:155 (+) Transcript_12005:17-481(+)|eukprot:CAMPEP_0170461316 /NCGR_PEP_ID=MMETSP0123-20130129/7272_1 /TAXON_ID=182087 /ORGANISM="Favella ehrenbergii, Strain Fehren 1" /LENGTH=154 /DNA_ID=CAMNT_0010726315 /DNA_START=17 /DNA_END=481 /DNA_ORIENTATION=+
MSGFRKFAGKIGQDGRNSKFPTFDKFEKEYIGNQGGGGAEQVADRANRGKVNEVLLKQMTEEYNRNYVAMQDAVKEKRQRIKDFDRKQEEKKIKSFDVEVVKKIETVLANKRSADYVKTLVNNTVPKQQYLYQRFAEEGAARQIIDGSPKKPKH